MIKVRRIRRLGTLSLAIGLATTACGGDTSTVETTVPDTSTTTAAAPTTTPVAESVVEVGMHDYSFDGLPESVPAGTRLEVVNHSEAELHELVAFRLADDEERRAADLAGLDPQELEAALGTPVTVLMASPGGAQIAAIGDGTLAEPGQYVIFCFIPTGVEPQVYLDAAAQSEGGPPEIEDAGPPHLVHGMVADLVVK